MNSGRRLSPSDMIFILARLSILFCFSSSEKYNRMISGKFAIEIIRKLEFTPNLQRTHSHVLGKCRLFARVFHCFVDAFAWHLFIICCHIQCALILIISSWLATATEIYLPFSICPTRMRIWKLFRTLRFIWFHSIQSILPSSAIRLHLQAIALWTAWQKENPLTESSDPSQFPSQNCCVINSALSKTVAVNDFLCLNSLKSRWHSAT